MHRVTQSKQCSFVRDGMDIEVVAERADTYDELLDKACAALDMQVQKKGYRLSLFTSGGAVVMGSGGWTLGSYLQQTHRSSTQTRFGVGYVKTVSYTVSYQMAHTANAHAEEAIKSFYKQTIE